MEQMAVNTPVKRMRIGRTDMYQRYSHSVESSPVSGLSERVGWVDCEIGLCECEWVGLVDCVSVSGLCEWIVERVVE